MQWCASYFLSHVLCRPNSDNMMSCLHVFTVSTVKTYTNKQKTVKHCNFRPCTADTVRQYPSIQTQESVFSSECCAYFHFTSFVHIFCTPPHEYCTCEAGSQLCLHWLLFSGLINVQDAHNSLPRDQSDALQIASFVQPTDQKPNTVHQLSWVTKASCKCLAFLPEKWLN